jgi:hypothetical protein
MAFGCKDPSLTYLNQYGYNVVTLPRTGIEPLLVLGRDRSLTTSGALATVWNTSSSLPIPGKPNRAANVEGQKSEKLDLSIGLKVLANALSAFGATTPSVDFAYQAAKKVQFTLTNVWSVGIAAFEVGEYLSNGDLKLSNPIVSRFFEDENSTAYIITEVLMSDSVSITATDSSSMEVAVDVPAISNVVGANVKVGTSNEGSKTVTYKGPEMVTFGFKAFEIAYVDGKWGIIGIKPAGAMALAHDEGQGQDATGVLSNPGGLVKI